MINKAKKKSEGKRKTKESKNTKKRKKQQAVSRNEPLYEYQIKKYAETLIDHTDPKLEPAIPLRRNFKCSSREHIEDTRTHLVLNARAAEMGSI